MQINLMEEERKYEYLSKGNGFSWQYADCTIE